MPIAYERGTTRATDEHNERLGVGDTSLMTMIDVDEEGAESERKELKTARSGVGVSKAPTEGFPDNRSIRKQLTRGEQGLWNPRLWRYN